MTGALQIVNENTIRLEDELEVSSDSRLCKFDYFNLRARAHSIEASDSKKTVHSVWVVSVHMTKSSRVRVCFQIPMIKSDYMLSFRLP